MANPNFKCPVDVQEMNKNLIEHIEHIEYLHKQAKMQSQEKIEKVSILNSTVEEDAEFEPNRRYCDDTDIEGLIFDSIIDETVENQLKQPSCNLSRTESYLTKDTRNSNSKTKYLFIYVCIIFPLFMIHYFQSKRYKNIKNDLNFSDSTCSSNSSN
jgi:hypothetical protein